MKHGKKYNEAIKAVEHRKPYPVVDAIKMLKEMQTAKFDETVEVSFKLNVDPRHADQLIRGAIVLPNGTGRSQTVLVITQGAKEEEAKSAGADFVGGKDMIEKIKGGWFDFDVIVATPDMMGELGKLGKELGPKGLMPNPKTGTVTTNVASAIEEIKKGKVAYRVDKDGNLNVLIGKKSFSEEALKENFDVMYNAVAKARPVSVKGTYIQSVTLSATMSPGIRIAQD